MEPILKPSLPQVQCLFDVSVWKQFYQNTAYTQEQPFLFPKVNNLEPKTQTEWVWDKVQKINTQLESIPRPSVPKYNACLMNKYYQSTACMQQHSLPLSKVNDLEPPLSGFEMKYKKIHMYDVCIMSKYNFCMWYDGPSPSLKVK